jgi:hypothetical protein
MEKIVLAAIKFKDVIWLGKRHNQIFEDIVKDTFIIPTRTEQGFLTSKCRFVTREEAKEIAFQAGQIKEKKSLVFTSEELW